MQANPNKFQALLLGSNCENDGFYFDIKGEHIKPNHSVNLLGVEIDSKLSFNNHISKICNKAGQQLSALARLSKMLDQRTKMIIFNSFILSNFNYCPLVWHHCLIGDARKIEKIQERGLRFVYNDWTSSYGSLLSKANRHLLFVDRLKNLQYLYLLVKMK